MYDNKSNINSKFKEINKNSLEKFQKKIENLNLTESSECQGYQSLFFFFSFSLFPSPKNPILFF